jgi:hypothetical protein
MKKVLMIIGAVVILAAIALPILRSQTKKHSPEAVASTTANGLDIEVRYCQPSKKGRLIFGEKTEGALQPYGEYWRAGANEATVFETRTDVLIAGKSLAAGKYNLYTYPAKTSWDICFGSDWDRWGATEPAKEKEVLRVTLPANYQADLQEVFTITFDPAGNMELRWDNARVMIPVAKP